MTSIRTEQSNETTHVDLNANFYYAAYQGKTKILIEEYHQKFLRKCI